MSNRNRPFRYTRTARSCLYKFLKIVENISALFRLFCGTVGLGSFHLKFKITNWRVLRFVFRNRRTSEAQEYSVFRESIGKWKEKLNGVSLLSFSYSVGPMRFM